VPLPTDAEVAAAIAAAEAKAAAEAEATARAEEGGTNNGIVTPGISGGNIVDGNYIDPVWTGDLTLEGLPGGGTGRDLISLIPGADTVQDTIKRGAEVVQGGIDKVTDPIRKAIENMGENIQVNFPRFNLPNTVSEIRDTPIDGSRLTPGGAYDLDTTPDTTSQATTIPDTTVAPGTMTAGEAYEAEAEAWLDENGIDLERAMEDPEGFLEQLKIEFDLGNISTGSFNTMTNMLQGAMGVSFGGPNVGRVTVEGYEGGM
jgi:hypothetical protein